MSILKDLDPQYAKLHTEPSPRKPAILAGVALLSLGSAYWIATQSTTKEALAEARPSPAQKSSGAAMKNEHSRDIPLENAKLPVSPASSPAPSVATIQEESSRAPIDQQTTNAAAAENSTRRRLADAEHPRPAQNAANRVNSVTSQKPENTKRKPPSTKTAAKNEKNQGAGGKKTGERDIDIITAIVR